MSGFITKCERLLIDSLLVDCIRCSTQGAPAHSSVMSSALQILHSALPHASHACLILDAPLMPSSRIKHHFALDSGSCMSHSRLHVLVTRHQTLSPASGLLMTCFPTSSIRSLLSDSRPVILRLMVCYGADSATLKHLAAPCRGMCHPSASSPPEAGVSRLAICQDNSSDVSCIF